MCKVCRLLVPLCVLVVLCLSGTSALAVQAGVQPSGDGVTMDSAAGQTTLGLTGGTGGTGGDGGEGDPDDIIDGNRAVPVVGGFSAAPGGQEPPDVGSSVLRLMLELFVRFPVLGL